MASEDSGKLISSVKEINRFPLLSGKRFFQLDESIEILCRSSPDAKWIATLLQLSKKTRRQIWDYLTDPNKCLQAWCDELCTSLWQYRENQPTYPVSYCSLHPVFIPRARNFTEERYYLARVIIKGNEISQKIDVLIGGFFSHGDNPKFSHPSWECAPNIETMTLFEWYIVAHALAIRMDTMIMSNAKELRDGVPVFPNDTTLYLI